MNAVSENGAYVCYGTNGKITDAHNNTWEINEWSLIIKNSVSTSQSALIIVYWNEIVFSYNLLTRWRHWRTNSWATVTNVEDLNYLSSVQQSLSTPTPGNKNK